MLWMLVKSGERRPLPFNVRRLAEWIKGMIAK
jgi:hypothetical protein